MRWHSDTPKKAAVTCSRPGLVAGLALGLALLLAVQALASEALLLRMNDSKVLRFSKMKRVWVANPEVIDVVVASYDELMVYTKQTGQTKLCVWDRVGRHEYAVEVRGLPTAEQVARELRGVLGSDLNYTIVDPAHLLVEGQVATKTEMERVESVIAAKTRTGLEIKNLVTVGQPRLSTAEEYQKVFEKLFPGKFRYLTIDETTLVIDGEVDTQSEMERVEGLIRSARSVQIISAVCVHSAARSQAERYAQLLQRILGDTYRYTPVGEAGLVVEGRAESPSEQERVAKIIGLMKGGADIVNLVATGPTSPGEQALDMLREGLGDKYTYKLVGDDVVLIEGNGAVPADRDRLDRVLAAIPAEAKIIDLVQPGMPGGEKRTAAAYERALHAALGNGLSYTVLDQNTLLVEGEVDTAGEKERIDAVLETLGGDTKFVNLVTVGGGGAMVGSRADRKAAVLQKVLGPKYECAAIAEDTVLIQGVAPGRAEQERLAEVVRQVAGEMTVVNMIAPSDDVGNLTAAARAIAGLRPVVPENVSLVELDDHTILIEGVVPTSIEKNRLDKLAEATSSSSEISVLSLVLSEMESKTPAARRIEGLKKILGDKYNYIVWDEETVLVEGSVDSERELTRVQKILEAANEDWKVGDLVTTGAEAGPLSTDPEALEEQMSGLVEQIADTIGEPYHVWRLKGRKIVVEGSAPDEAALARLKALLEAFAGEADIISLVGVAAEPVVPLTARAESLRAVLGDDFSVRVLQGKALVVEAKLRTKQEAEKARAILNALGSDVPIVDLVTTADATKRQVVAHVKVADVNRGVYDRMGADWGEVIVDPSGNILFDEQPFLVRVESGVQNVFPIAANLTALQGNDDARILAQPNLVVNEGEEAQIVVGGEIPIPVPQAGGGAAAVTIMYKQYGVILKMKPTIMPDGKSLKLEIEPEVSSIDTATQVTIAGINVPAFRTRRAKTIVDMPSGATLVIGGLIQHDQSKVIRGVPFLSKLPIIGSLFRREEWKEGLTELIILVTPEIIDSSAAAPSAVSSSTDTVVPQPPTQ